MTEAIGCFLTVLFLPVILVVLVACFPVIAGLAFIWACMSVFGRSL